MNATRKARGFSIVAASLLLAGLAVGSAQAEPIKNGLQLWLDATDGDTFTFDTVNPASVTKWKDKSDNEYYATPLSMMPTLQPNAIGGKPAVFFSRAGGNSTALDIQDEDGNLANFGIQANGRRTAFAVIRYTTPSVSNFILGTSLQAVVDVGNGNGGMRLRNVNAVKSSDAGTVPGSTDAVIAVRADQVAPHITTAYHNGDQIIDTDAYVFHWQILTHLQVGGANYDSNAYQGHIAEVLLYNRALNSSEMSSVGNYLRQKYNISSLGVYGVPEPSALLLLIAGLTCLARGRRRKCHPPA